MPLDADIWLNTREFDGNYCNEDDERVDMVSPQSDPNLQ
jgi:hypothetical protein